MAIPPTPIWERPLFIFITSFFLWLSALAIALLSNYLPKDDQWLERPMAVMPPSLFLYAALMLPMILLLMDWWYSDPPNKKNLMQTYYWMMECPMPFTLMTIGIFIAGILYLM